MNLMVGVCHNSNQLAKYSNKSCLEINLERTLEIADYFQSQQPKQIWNLLKLHFKHQANDQNSLLFLDEIQATPKIIAYLRYDLHKYGRLKKLPIIRRVLLRTQINTKKFKLLSLPFYLVGQLNRLLEQAVC